MFIDVEPTNRTSNPSSRRRCAADSAIFDSDRKLAMFLRVTISGISNIDGLFSERTDASAKIFSGIFRLGSYLFILPRFSSP